MASDWERGIDYEYNEPLQEWEQELLGVKHASPGKPPLPYQGENKKAVRVSEREKLLDEAKHLITGDRNNQYGPPHQDFTRTASLWTALGFEFNGRPVESHHVALAMIQLKSSRLAWQPEKFDSWADIAGYSGCGWECVVEDTA